EDGIRDGHVTGVQTCALPIFDVPFGRVLTRLGYATCGDEHGEGGDGQVHEEDPAPTELVGQEAAEHRADRVAKARYSEDEPARRSEERRVGNESRRGGGRDGR